MTAIQSENKFVSDDTNYDLTEYSKLNTAFNFFNEKLFNNKLSSVFITVQRHANALGFFRTESFHERKFNEKHELEVPGYSVHEIAIMPEGMYGRTDREILSTLVHEMCHLQQHEQGKPSRNGYHNREWADYMFKVGLHPSSVGTYDKRNPDKKPSPDDIEGSETGQGMSHFIIKDGPFELAFKELLKSGFAFKLHSTPSLRMKAPKSKFKYTCPKCGSNAWAKKDIKLSCGECDVLMVMEDEE